MPEPEDNAGPWWQRQPEDRPVLLAFVKVDRAGSTREWDDLPAEEVRRRRDAYFAGVGHVARCAGAAQPLHWQGDGVMLFLAGDEEAPAPVKAYRVARLIWEQVRIDLKLPARIAVHAAVVLWKHDTGALSDPAIDLCGHLEQAAPVNGVIVSEDVRLCLPDADRRELAPLGVTARDGAAAYVYPAAMAQRKDPAAFLAADDLALWEDVREYVNSPEVRHLRYVGFRLAKKEPPSLDILKVFVPLMVERRRRGPGASLAEAERFAAERARGSPAAGDDELPFARLAGRGETTTTERFEQVLRRRRGLVVLGEPGSGKTTLLRWLAVVAAGGPLKLGPAVGLPERLLPLPVSVGMLAGVRREMKQRDHREPSVIEALASCFHSRNVGASREQLGEFLRARLEAGQCLVLLDGLDEVVAEQRRGVRDWLETFAANYPKNRFIVSSRPVGYAGFVLPDGAEITLRPFDDGQVRRYVEAFCGAYHRWETGIETGEGGREAAAGLMRAVEDSPRLHALARNPFLLSGLALIHRAEGTLPRHRVQFYEIFARALCETWDAARRMVATEASRDIPFEEEAVPLLGELAGRMHAEHPTGLAPEAFVLDSLGDILARRKGVARDGARRAAGDFLRRCGERAQIFLERAPGQWGFLHLTFLEFFVAAGLHAAERFEAEAWKHLHEPRWEEVLRLGVGYLALCQKRPVAARKFVERVFREGGGDDQPEIARALRRYIPLAALLAAEAGDALPDDLQDEIAEAFVDWADWLPCELARRARREIGLTDFRQRLAARYLPNVCDSSQSRGSRTLALAALRQVRAASAVESLLPLLADKNEDTLVRALAADVLGAIGAFSAVQPLLSLLLDKGEDHTLRSCVASALGTLQASSAVHPLSVILVDKEEHHSLRAAAASALGAQRASSAREALLALVSDKREHVSLRECACDALVALEGAWGIQALRQVLSDESENPYLRGSAVGALATLAPSSAMEALLPLRKTDDGYLSVRVEEALLAVDPSLPTEAIEAALQHRDWAVRVHAAGALAALGARPAIEPLLGLLKDENPLVRSSAACALGALGATTAVEPLVSILSDQNEHWEMRGSAAEALGALGASSAVEPLLAALKDEDSWVRASAADALEGLLS